MTRLVWVGGLTTTILVLDLLIPVGFAIWMLYLVPVWFTLRPHWQRLSLAHAALCSLFILASFYGSPPGGPIDMAMVNRFLGVAMVWGVVLLGLRRQQAEDALLTAHIELERRVQERTADLTHTHQVLEGQIRERRRAEAGWRESQEQFTAAFHDAAIGMALVGTDGQWLQVNRALCAIVGYTEQELLATNFQAITHPDDLEADLAYVTQLLAGEIPTYQIEKRYFHKLGHIVWIQLNVSLVHDGDSRPVHFVAQIQNVTDRNRVAAELRESEARLQAILHNSPTLIFLKDTEGRYLLVNRQFERTFRLTREDIVGKTDAELFPPVQAAAFRANDITVLQADAPLQFEEIALHDDGPHISIVMKFPLRDGTGKAYAIGGITTDITDRKRAEHALRTSEEDLRRVVEEREQLSSDLHDNTIQTICAVGMGLEECQHLIHESPAAAGHHLTHAIAELNVVIRDVRRHLVGPDAEAPTSAEYVQRELTRLTQTVEHTHGLHFRMHVEEPALDRLSQKVAQQVMAITREAVSNSLRHSGASMVSVSLQADGTTLRLAIEDNGVGFDSESQRSHGHGLRNIAARTQQIGGTLQVMAQPGQGTHILVHFPGESSHARI
ncbi:MAG: PAS domain-containing sensor histidine kinase [Nitrospiraceae bacterium]